MDENNIIICRCEDLSLAELRDVIEDGYETIDEIKRVIRLGMGPCRGGTCLQLIDRVLAEYQGTGRDAIQQPTNRPPVEGMKLKEIAGDLDEI